jgi:predicted RecA/RadA family phage recombinase
MISAWVLWIIAAATKTPAHKPVDHSFDERAPRGALRRFQTQPWENDMKNFVQKGDCVTLTAGADVLGGGLVVAGVLCGVAQHDALAGDPVEVMLTGVYDLAKVSAQAWDEGDAIYVDPATALATTETTTGNLFIGAAIAVAVNPSATGTVRLNGSAPEAVTA